MPAFSAPTPVTHPGASHGLTLRHALHLACSLAAALAVAARGVAQRLLCVVRGAVMVPPSQALPLPLPLTPWALAVSRDNTPPTRDNDDKAQVESVDCKSQWEPEAQAVWAVSARPVSPLRNFSFSFLQLPVPVRGSVPQSHAASAPECRTSTVTLTMARCPSQASSGSTMAVVPQAQTCHCHDPVPHTGPPGTTGTECVPAPACTVTGACVHRDGWSLSALQVAIGLQVAVVVSPVAVTVRAAYAWLAVAVAVSPVTNTGYYWVWQWGSALAPLLLPAPGRHGVPVRVAVVLVPCAVLLAVTAMHSSWLCTAVTRTASTTCSATTSITGAAVACVGTLNVPVARVDRHCTTSLVQVVPATCSDVSLGPGACTGTLHFKLTLRVALKLKLKWRLRPGPSLTSLLVPPRLQRSRCHGVNDPDSLSASSCAHWVPRVGPDSPLVDAYYLAPYCMSSHCIMPSWWYFTGKLLHTRMQMYLVVVLSRSQTP
jgi:hypothetical protein